MITTNLLLLLIALGGPLRRLLLSGGELAALSVADVRLPVRLRY